MRRALALVVAFAPLAACGTVGSLRSAVAGPSLTPMVYPAAMNTPPPGGAPMSASIAAPLGAPAEPTPPPASANSLWRAGSSTFFIDQRARRVGDILTVLVEIDDSAKTQNTSNASRTTANKAGLPHIFGLESTLGKILPKAYDPTDVFETNSTTSNAGAGAIDRSEQISLTIAAVVTQVLPNGNLVIQGTQEVRTDNEVRSLTVAGIVRPEDVSSANTIRHTQLAEARISYGGRGDVSAVQKTPPGTSILQRVAPF